MEKQRSSSQNFLTGAAILSLSTIIVKIIGMFYKIPLQQLIGENGFAYFTAAYDIYTVLLVVSTTGLPVAMSRMVSEAKTLGNGAQMQRIFQTAMTVYLVLGIVGTGAMMLLPSFLATEVMGMPNASYSIFALGPAVLFICIASACRGYFQGQGDMRPTAFSQIIEAMGKLVLGLGLAWLVMEMTGNDSYASGGTIAGISIGAGLSALFVYTKYRRNRKNVTSMGGKALSTRTTAKMLLAIAIPITIGSAGLQLINLLDSVTVMHRLVSVADEDSYIEGRKVTIEDGRIHTEDSSLVWIVDIENGNYRFRQGKINEENREKEEVFFLKGTAENNALDLVLDMDGGGAGWQLTPCDSNQSSYYISCDQSQEKDIFLSADISNNAFVSSNNANTEFCFYVLSEEENVYILTSEIKAQDSVIICNVGNSFAVTSDIQANNQNNAVGQMIKVAQEKPKEGMPATQNASEIAKGIYSYCQTVFNLPTAFIPCITAAIIPAITANLTRKDRKGVKQVQNSSLRVMALISSPCAVGLLVLAEPVMALLGGYDGDKLTIAAWLLALLAPTVLVNSITTMTTAIMQAHNHMVLPVINTLIGGVLKVIVNFILVGNPDIGILGAPIGTFVCFLVIMVLNIICMRHVLQEPPKLLPALWRSGLAAIVMGVVAFFAYGLLWNYLASYAICCIGAIGVAVLVYFLLVILLKAITYEDCLLLPKGEKIAKILRIH